MSNGAISTLPIYSPWTSMKMIGGNSHYAEETSLYAKVVSLADAQYLTLI